MTQKEKGMLQTFVNQYGEFSRKSDEIFNFLKEKNVEEGTGNAWCCAELNYKGLLKNGHDYTYKLELYHSYNAKMDLLRELMSELAELNFWKK